MGVLSNYTIERFQALSPRMQNIVRIGMVFALPFRLAYLFCAEVAKGIRNGAREVAIDLCDFIRAISELRN